MDPATVPKVLPGAGDPFSSARVYRSRRNALEVTFRRLAIKKGINPDRLLCALMRSWMDQP